MDSKTEHRNESNRIKPLTFGVVLALLSLANIFFSVMTITVIDPLYQVITQAGVILAIPGVWKKQSMSIF